MTACLCRHAAVSHRGKMQCGKCACHGYKRQPIANLPSIAKNPNLRVTRGLRVCSCSHPRMGHTMEVEGKMYGGCSTCACCRYVEAAAVIAERIRLPDA